MHWTTLRPFLTSVLLAGYYGQMGASTGTDDDIPKCKCVQGEDCWPSSLEWKLFDRVVGGNLIKTEPLAQSCYPGPHKDHDECSYVNSMWTDQDFQVEDPIGRSYPYNVTCPPVNYSLGETPGTCSLGSLPTYAVKATTREHIAATLTFATVNNLRLSVSGTGHDLIGRGDGYSSLSLWLHHFKTGIYFQKKYTSANQCTKSGWKGSAIKIDGVYQWYEVYEVAKKNNVIAVGGGSLSPGAIGGWASGGGHGPATRNYGMGADQILEAEVMLSDGRVVTVNHCDNADLFKAMRGGGPGYGITLSSTIKAHPNVKTVTAHHLAIAPRKQTEKNKDLLDAVAVLMQNYADLSDAGFAGYGYWFRNFPTEFVLGAKSGYTHGFWTIGKKKKDAQKAWEPVRKALKKFEKQLIIEESWATYNDYWSFYFAESGLRDPVGSTSVLTSRLIDRAATKDYKKVRDTVEVVSGHPQGVDANVVLLVSGGQVFEDAKDKSSGLHPAWRKSHYLLISGAGLPPKPTLEQRQDANEHTTYVKGAATKKLAPNTGGYMNEGDRHDPDYRKTFYGDHYSAHLKTKRKYDPYDVFYCPTCVGSEDFIERPDGPLCRV